MTQDDKQMTQDAQAKRDAQPGAQKQAVTGSELILDFLTAKGVDVTFGYPGGPVIALFDEIWKRDFPIILTRHEQGAAHAAEGYAKLTGRPGVVFATSGPGATNLITGIADAYLDSVPMLAITGAVARKATGTDAFQEADITGIASPVTKYSYFVLNAEELPAVLEEAWHLTTDGRPGPVLVNVPKDILASPIEGIRANSVYARHRPPKQRTGLISAQLFEALRHCKQPLLLAGGGCVISAGAPELLLRFAETLRLPVTTTLMGKGAFPAEHPLYLGQVGMHGTPQANVALGNCDLLLIVGSRISDRLIGNPSLWNQASADRFIVHVDIDPAEIGKNIRVNLEIEDDAAAFFRTMLRRLPAASPQVAWQAWIDRLSRLAERFNERVAEMYVDGPTLRPQAVIHAVAQRLRGKDPIVVTDVGQHQMFAAQHYPIESPRSFLTSGGLGTMGFGLPAAIGASLAAPERPCVLFVGDGGYQMTIQELGVLSAMNLPVTIVLMDNACLGMVRQWQELFYEQRYSCTMLKGNPDFVAIAKAYRIPGGEARTHQEFRDQLELALAAKGPYLIHTRIDPAENVFPMIPAGKMPQDLIMPGLERDGAD